MVSADQAGTLSRQKLMEAGFSHVEATAALDKCRGDAEKALAAATTTPFDVVKTRRQVYSSVGAFENEGTHAALDGNGSTPRVLRAIIREEGVAGAFRGFNARLIKIAPACAIMISSYEAGKRAFGLVD